MPIRSLLLSGAGLAAFATAVFAQATPPAAIQVPDGFEVVRVAAPPLVSFPMLGGFDERGRLFVAENAGLTLSRAALESQTPSRIRMLEDTDGDGIFDRSTIFADQLTFPQGVQWHEGALYVASPPSIWRLADTDGDGRADARKEIVTGFSFDGNAADVHGPFLHPNGRLYWCHGRKGHEVYQQNGSLVSKGIGARIWSCRPDGSDIQVHAGGGMDNPVELAFNQEGDMFGTVNLFHGTPRADAVVHWIHGGVYPRADQGNALAEFKRTGDLLGPLAVLGHVAPSGAALVRNETWRAEFQGNLFLAEFNTRRIMRIVLERDDATFRGRPEVFASTAQAGVHFTDVIEDADGSLLVIDTGEWYRRCPTTGFKQAETPGGIYRVRRVASARPADPRGLSIPWAEQTPASLLDLLADVRPFVRDRATAELVRKAGAAIGALDRALDDPRYLVRSNAVWALTRIGTPAARAAARRALGDTDYRLRQAACQSAFATADHEAFDRLIPLLRDESLAVRREAARALGQLREPAAVPELAAAAAMTTDSVLMHALIHAVIAIDRRAETSKLVDAPHPLTRRVGLIALDQNSPSLLQPDAVFQAMRSPDARLRSAACSIALQRPQWGAEAAGYLDFAFSDDRDAGRVETGARVLAAFLRTTEVRDWLRAQLASSGRLAGLNLRRVLDAIASATSAWDEAWREPISSALRSTDLALAQAALRAIGRYRRKEFSGELRLAAQDMGRPTAFRVAALQAAAGGDQALDDESFRMLMEPFVTGGSPDTRQQAAAVLADVKLSRVHAKKLAAQLIAAGPMELPLLLRTFLHAPAEAEIAAVLLDNLKAAPARWSLVGQELQRLFRRFPAPSFDNAVPLISEIMNQAVTKDSRVTELEKIAIGGNAARGRTAFLSGAGACISCHRVGDAGATIGPDLSHIGRIRSTRDLIEAIAFPGATIARGFETFNIHLGGKETITGTIPRETADEVVVATSDGREQTIARASIAKLEPVEMSLMPIGLDRALAPETLADLIAFLHGLR